MTDPPLPINPSAAAMTLECKERGANLSSSQADGSALLASIWRAMTNVKNAVGWPRFTVLVYWLGVVWSGSAQAAPEQYAGCYTDMDGFVLGIGADLSAYRQLRKLPQLPAYKEILDDAYAMHRIGVVPMGKGWLFQPGGHSDHPDHWYAGWNGTGRAPNRAKVDRIAWDSSHFSRWPLWLSSFENAETNPTRKAYYNKLRAGLAEQLMTKVLVKPDKKFRTYRLTNYMDGRNGVYRWNEQTKSGIGPYQLTVTFTMGWWSLLDDARIRNVYSEMSAAFPLTPQEHKVIFGTVTRIDHAYAAHIMRLAALGPNDQVPPQDLLLWYDYESVMLANNLWEGETAQSSLMDLLIPLHVAFERNLPNWQSAYAEYFARFQAAGPKKSGPKNMGQLNELHALTFASQFIVLAARHNRTDLIPAGLPQLVERRLLALWENAGRPVSQTGWGEPEFRNYRDYLIWKRKQTCPRPKAKAKGQD